jgi:hypothetical protein
MIRNKCRVCERPLRLCRLPGTNAPNFLEAGFWPTSSLKTIPPLNWNCVNELYDAASVIGGENCNLSPETTDAVH